MAAVARRAEGSAAFSNNSLPLPVLAPVPERRRPGGGLDALIRGLADAASGAATASTETTSKETISKADALEARLPIC